MGASTIAGFLTLVIKPLRRALPWYTAVCLIAVLIYYPGLGGPFLFDDYGNIVDNRAVQITSLSGSALAGSLSGPIAGPLGRPISVLSFALTHYAFGLDPFVFKAINLGIHLLSGLLVCLLAGVILRHSNSGVSETARKWLPLWAGAIWTLHPINVVPVLLAVQRMTLLAGLFTLLALIGHARGLLANKPAKKAAWFVGSWAIAWPLAVLSKETAILFPLYALILSWALAGDVKQSSLRRVTLAGLAATAVVGIFFLVYLGNGWLERGYEMRTFTLYERLLTEVRVLWLYAGQILFPVYRKFGLFLDGFPVSRGLLNPVSTLLAVTGWLAVLAGCAVLLRRHRLIGLSILWFLVGHSLESSFLPLEIAHEYRNYLPSLGLILAAGLTGFLIVKQMKKPEEAKIAIALFGGISVILASIYTGMRSIQYSDELKGTQTEVSYHPRSPRANYVVASTFMQHGYGAQGDPLGDVLIKHHFLEAGRLDPSFKLGYLGLIIWACASGRPLDNDWTNELEHRLRNTPFSPKDWDLAAKLLPPLLTFKGCVDRASALQLFVAGSENPRLGNNAKAGFLEMAADYELLIHTDLPSSIRFLTRALEIAPQRKGLRRKLNSLKTASTEAENAAVR